MMCRFGILMRPIMRILTSLALSILLGLIAAAAQQPDAKSPITPKVEVPIASCNENNSHLSILNQYSAESAIIIVISRPGQHERRDISSRRLHNALNFLVKEFRPGFKREPGSIVTAEGERVEGRGYLDFYVQGNLELQIFFEKDRDLLVPPCVFSPEEKPCSTVYEAQFYPCKKE